MGDPPPVSDPFPGTSTQKKRMARLISTEFYGISTLDSLIVGGIGGYWFLANENSVKQKSKRNRKRLVEIKKKQTKNDDSKQQQQPKKRQQQQKKEADEPKKQSTHNWPLHKLTGPPVTVVERRGGRVGGWVGVEGRRRRRRRRGGEVGGGVAASIVISFGKPGSRHSHRFPLLLRCLSFLFSSLLFCFFLSFTSPWYLSLSLFSCSRLHFFPFFCLALSSPTEKKRYGSPLDGFT